MDRTSDHSLSSRKGVHYDLLCPVRLWLPVLGFGEQHTHGVRLGHDVPVCEVLTCDGELHPGHRQRGGAGHPEWSTAAVWRRGCHCLLCCCLCAMYNWLVTTPVIYDSMCVITCRKLLSANRVTHHTTTVRQLYGRYCRLEQSLLLRHSNSNFKLIKL